MKAQFIIITLLFGLLTVNGYSSNNTNPRKEKKKEIAKASYDFNIFSFFMLKENSSDSLKIRPIILTTLKRKED